MRPVGRTSFGRAVAAATSSPIGIGNGRFHYATEACDVETVYLGTFDRRTIVAVGGYDEAGIQWAAEDQELAFRCDSRAEGSASTHRSDPGTRRGRPLAPSGISTATTGSARPRRCASTAACPICARSLRPRGRGDRRCRGGRHRHRRPLVAAAPLLAYTVGAAAARLHLGRDPGVAPHRAAGALAICHWGHGIGFLTGLFRIVAGRSFGDTPKAVDVPLPDRKRLNEYATKGVDLGLRTLAIAPSNARPGLSPRPAPPWRKGHASSSSARGWSYHLQVEGVLGQALAEQGSRSTS